MRTVVNSNEVVPSAYSALYRPPLLEDPLSEWLAYDIILVADM
jgi:hypothetical protein